MPHPLVLLIADDEPSLLSFVEAAVEGEGFGVLKARDGDEALKLFESEHVDVVLCDVRMPHLDGIGFLERAGDQKPDVPVILMTAYGEKKKIVEALKHGAFDFLEKPFGVEGLRLALRRAAARRRIERARSNEQERLRVLERTVRDIGAAADLGELRAAFERSLPRALEASAFAVFRSVPGEPALRRFAGSADEELYDVAARTAHTCIQDVAGRIAALPLLQGIEPVGVLAFRKDDGVVETVDLPFAALVADHVAAAIHARRWSESLRRAAERVDERARSLAEAVQDLEKTAVAATGGIEAAGGAEAREMAALGAGFRALHAEMGRLRQRAKELALMAGSNENDEAYGDPGSNSDRR